MRRVYALDPGLSAGADNRHRRDLDRRGKGQRVRPQRRARVLASCAQHVDEQLRRTVHHFWLVAKAIGGQDETDDLAELLHAVQPNRSLDLGQHVQPALPRASSRFFDRDLVGTAPSQQQAAIAGDLACDVQERATVADWD